MVRRHTFNQESLSTPGGGEGAEGGRGGWEAGGVASVIESNRVMSPGASQTTVMTPRTGERAMDDAQHVARQVQPCNCQSGQRASLTRLT